MYNLEEVMVMQIEFEPLEEKTLMVEFNPN
jgi:hypothetical protein